jgi:hypothetical protein
MSSKWLFTSTFFLELSSIYGLLGGSASLASILAFSSLHGLASLCLTAGIWPLLPKRYRQPLPWSPLFLLSVAFFIPLLGMLGIVLAIFPALYFPRKKAADIWQLTAIPDLPFRANAPDMNTMLSMGGLQDVLRHAGSSNKRLAAVLETRRMSSRDAIPILKLALRDSADDVRLLAYSMLDGKENQINLKIRTLLEELESSAAELHPQLHAGLAQHYWELVYLGLAQGSVLEHMLSSAQRHIASAIAGQSTPQAWLLAGRIALEQQRLDAAEQAFDEAEKLGMDAAQLATYRAEVAFCRRDFAAICGWLEQLGPDERQRTSFAALTQYWKSSKGASWNLTV